MQNTFLTEMGARISSKRKNMGITQEKLAEKMDVSIQMISNLELGKKAIRPENLVKLCSILNVSTDYILTGKISEYESNTLSEKILKLNKSDIALLENIISFLYNNK